MYCMKCNKDLSDCSCSDLAERLESLKDAPNFIYRMCRKCEKHYNICKCENPDWTTSVKGIELDDCGVNKEDLT